MYVFLGLFLLQQRRDVYVPAYGLAIKAASEEIARRVILTPSGAADHSTVALSIAARKTS